MVSANKTRLRRIEAQRSSRHRPKVVWIAEPEPGVIHVRWMTKAEAKKGIGN